MDKAEADVGHRRPVGHGDGDRIGRQSTLGVERAVDRVDHDERLVAAEINSAAFLRQGGEARARVKEFLQLGKDDLLGLLIDQQGVVAAGADRAGLDYAFVALRRRRQQFAQRGRAASGKFKPVKAENR